MPLPFQRRPGAQLRPSFSRDFAGLKTLDHGVGPAISFTRASNATYFDASGVLQTAPYNLLLHSEDFGNAAWDKVLGATVTTNNVTAPDGSATADTISLTSSNTNRVDQLLGTAANGETWTFSVWLKGSGTVRILADTSSGVGGATEINITLTSTWTRHSATVTYSSPTGNRRAAIIWRTGNTATSVDVWGAQFVSGIQAGEYFRTTDAAASMPRFDHSGGSSLGLLIEEARTNLLERSAEFDNAYWTKQGTTASANTSAAPDGTTSADTISETATNAAHFLSRTISITSGTSYTLSVFAKAGTSSILMLTLGDNEFGTPVPRAWFNLSTGAVGSTVGAPSATSIQSVGNGWYRCTITKAATSTASAAFYISITDTDGNAAAYSGSTSNNFLIWGAQLEQGAFPTSYIPTTTAAATRSADSAVVTPISGFYNQAEGTFITATNKSPLSGSFPTIWHLTNGTNDTGNIIGFYNPSNSTISYDASPAFSFAEAVSAGFATSGFALSAASARMAVNGVLEPSTDQSATITTDKASIRLGAKRNGSEPLNGHIRKIAYYPKRLSNTLLQQLTT